MTVLSVEREVRGASSQAAWRRSRAGKVLLVEAGGTGVEELVTDPNQWPRTLGSLCEAGMHEQNLSVARRRNTCSSRLLLNTDFE
jgi:hypothetical protein